MGFTFYIEVGVPGGKVHEYVKINASRNWGNSYRNRIEKQELPHT